MNKRRILTIFVISVSAAVIIIAVLLIGHPAKKQTLTIQGAERGSASNQVDIQGADRLYDILLSKQYFAVKQQLSNYIRAKISSSAISAQIVSSSTVVNKDGSVSFSVTMDDPKETFDVVLQRPGAATIIFAVPASGYSVTLQPYEDHSE